MSHTPEPFPDHQACPDAPEHIWLQFDDDGLPAPQWDGEGVTWCSDKINENDVLYVRADIHDALRAALQTQGEEAAKLIAQRDELLAACRRAVVALAAAAEQTHAFQSDYDVVSAAITNATTERK